MPAYTKSFYKHTQHNSLCLLFSVYMSFIFNVIIVTDEFKSITNLKINFCLLCIFSALQVQHSLKRW